MPLVCSDPVGSNESVNLEFEDVDTYTVGICPHRS